MNFINAYKRLEKLCSDMYGDNHGLSAYIDEMIVLPDGRNCVPNWDVNLKTLKHYRWVRNQIVHEPGCTEENLCSKADADWLDDFYAMIMKQTDPLALYRQAAGSQRMVKPAARQYSSASAAAGRAASPYASVKPARQQERGHLSNSVQHRKKRKKSAWRVVLLLAAIAAGLYVALKYCEIDFMDVPAYLKNLLSRF